MTRFCFSKILFLAGFVVAIAPKFSAAQEAGPPIAIRNWANGGITVETMSGLTVAAGFKSRDNADKKTSEDATTSRIDFHAEELVKGGADSIGVSRKPNAEDWSTRQLSGDAEEPAEGEVAVAFGEMGASISIGMLQVNKLDDLPSEESLAKAKEGIENARKSGNRLVVIAIGAQFDKAACEKIIESTAPRILIVSEAIEQVGETKVEKIVHNTIAFSNRAKLDAKTRVVSLGTEPYKMSDELADLFAKKEAASKLSREMFAKLSVKQMNFKPSNGSHTPRWNTEHMMGRELLFFSQIFNAVDPMISIVDLNPKQMPEDYEFAHEDWTGAEEARQTKRVEDFVRRFAYLLDGMDLNKKAKGSRFWSPRALLKQMERHYKEHSDNVVKKMKLDGWPADDDQ